MAFTASGGSFWDRHCYQNMRYYDNNSQHQKPAKAINYLFIIFLDEQWMNIIDLVKKLQKKLQLHGKYRFHNFSNLSILWI